MVISSPREAVRAAEVTAGVPVVLPHHDVVMHVPAEVAERARAAAAGARADLVIALGGGSATGLAKAIALASGLPVIAVPTTYAGSEATAVWGLTEGDAETTGTDPAAAAAIVPAVPPSNPRPVSAASLERLLRAAWAGASPDQAA